METLERGDTTISDKEVFPQGSHPWNTWRSIILLCFNTSAGRVPRGKECAKPPEKWWMSVQMQRPSKGPGEKEGKSMYTKEQSLNTRWQWQVSSSKADQHHPSYQQKTHYRNLNINHVPHQGREDYQNMYSKQRLSSQHRSLCPRVAACVVQYITLKAERCRNYVPKQELYQNKRYMPNTEIPWFC